MSILDNEERFRPSKFNMSQLILIRINNMQTRAAEYYMAGDLDKWFFTWKSIKFQIIGRLEPEERIILKQLETRIHKKIRKPKRVIPLIEEYLEKIQDYIEEKDIGLIGKSDETVWT